SFGFKHSLPGGRFGLGVLAQHQRVRNPLRYQPSRSPSLSRTGNLNSLKVAAIQQRAEGGKRKAEGGRRKAEGGRHVLTAFCLLLSGLCQGAGSCPGSNRSSNARRADTRPPSGWAAAR